MNKLLNSLVSPQHTIKLYVLLVLLCIAFYLPGLATMPLIDRDSAHFVQATRQMLETGQFFQIRYQEKTRFQKPPGINWLQAAAVKLFSQPQATAVWPYRLPSLLGGIIAVLIFFTFTRLLWNNTLAFLASSLLASTFLLTLESHLAVTDAALLACVVAMQCALGWIYLHAQSSNTKSKTVVVLIFWLALSLGILIKGITPLFAVLTIVTLGFWDRDLRWLKDLKIAWGIPLLLLSSSWIIFVSQAEHANYLGKMIQKDLLPKLISGHESHGGWPGYHLFLSPLTLWPTSLFLWPAAIWTWRARHLPTIKFLLAWLLPAWLFFELMPTKLPQYVLPTFPVICLLMALAIYHAQSSRLNNIKPTQWLTSLHIAWGVLGIGLSMTIFFAPLALKEPLNAFNVTTSLLIIMTTVAACYLSYRSHLLQSAWVIIIGAFLSYALLFHAVIPRLSPLWLSEKIMHTIQQHVPEQFSQQQPLFVTGYYEPSLVFLLGTHSVKFAKPVELVKLNVSPGKKYILVEKRYLSLLSPEQSRIITHIRGFNYSKGKWVNLILMERHV